jgi:hypothetical protein
MQQLGVVSSSRIQQQVPSARLVAACVAPSCAAGGTLAAAGTALGSACEARNSGLKQYQQLQEQQDVLLGAR